MTRAVIVLFLGGSPEAHAVDLEAWAQARLVEIRAPETDLPADRAPPKELALRVEDRLEAARLLSATLDEQGARVRLGEAEQLLRDHPELPQAPWLMAERLMLEAALPGGAERAAELRQAAALLEGERAPVYATGTIAEPPPVRGPMVERLVVGLSPRDRLAWNAQDSALRLTIAPGEHHARVTRRGRTIWAGWVEVAPDVRRISLPVPQPVACSFDDLGATRIVGDRVIAEPPTRCERWAVARPAAGGGVEVASCERARCGPLLAWSRGYGAIYEGPPQPPPATGFPTWAALTLAGAGAVAVAGIVAWRAGVFDEPAPAGTTFRFYAP
jgi:hypothetical protein